MKDDPLKTGSHMETERIKQAVALAKAEKPAYGELYPLLEALFLLQAEIKPSIQLAQAEFTAQVVQTCWENGFPLLKRWDFPLDIQAAAAVLASLESIIPPGNKQIAGAHRLLTASLADHPEENEAIWRSFLQHEWDPWGTWIDTAQEEMPAILFLARSCLRPSLERVAEDIVERFPIPSEWLKGYCPICGSLPALLYLEGEGERKACCSWCGTHWGIHRLQCPQCDNRCHESLGYLTIEAEPYYRAHYCRICKVYFKLIDTRELLYPPYFPLEEWTTLHLDLLAQRAGWQQPASPSPVVYKDDNP